MEEEKGGRSTVTEAPWFTIIGRNEGGVHDVGRAGVSMVTL